VSFVKEKGEASVGAKKRRAVPLVYAAGFCAVLSIPFFPLHAETFTYRYSKGGQ